MEVLLYNSTVCRLCGEENDNGTLLYSCEENSQNLSEVVNTFLPIKISDDGQLPRTICPGCTIQLEATVEFINLIINGQKVIRELHSREKEYKKSLNWDFADKTDIITDKIIHEINTSDGVYQVEHPIALQVAGIDKPKRKRGRPPKKKRTPEELALEAAERQRLLAEAEKSPEKGDELSGKRRRKTPERFKEVVQGKELERIFKEEGVIDADDSDDEIKKQAVVDPKPFVSKEPEVIGHMETSGELIVVVKGKGRGRPKGRMRPTREECAICGLEFSCVGRYMSHIAQHGPVRYQCGQCVEIFDTRLLFNKHQNDVGHTGQIVIPCGKNGQSQEQKVVPFVKNEHEHTGQTLPSANEQVLIKTEVKSEILTKSKEALNPVEVSEYNRLSMTSLPDLNAQLVVEQDPLAITLRNMGDSNVIEVESSSREHDEHVPENKVEENSNEKLLDGGSKEKLKLKCTSCDKVFSSKQSRSLHIKAVHNGEKPYACGVCGSRFAYPRSLTLHSLSHRSRRAPLKGFACDLCGKVLNHPSSVVYHKEAEHAGQRYVCNKCGKSFKHKQLLQRHQLVHSQLRPYTCKLCNASFKTKANLVNHQLLHSGVKRYFCEICNQKFAHKTSLTLHMRWHTGQKPYSCGTCGKSFSQKGNLSEHERIHTGEKPYQCEHCPRRFTTSSQHRLHVQRHNSERPHKCKNCEKRFSTRGACQLHESRSSCGPGGRAPPRILYRCPYCPRSFPERWALTRHTRRHTGERPHRCPHCPRAFADLSNLNKHKRQVHKQISLLVNEQNISNLQESEEFELDEDRGSQISAVESLPHSEMEERVIYVTYNMEEPDTPQFHILDPEQESSMSESKVLTTCSLYSGSSLLMPAGLEPEPVTHVNRSQLLAPDERIEVTDEAGNPLHFTMQDGTRLAITSVDGSSLQVVTQDGQTIPVEINSYSEQPEEMDSSKTIIHQVNLRKSMETNETHYYTFV